MPEKSLSNHYLNKFERPGNAHLESLQGAESTTATITDNTVKEILERSDEGLHQLIENHPGSRDTELTELVKHILQEGGEALWAVARGDDNYLNSRSDQTKMLEVIVQTDGSRPSFLIKDDKVDFQSSPAGDWEDILITRADQLRTAIQCVGRINKGEIQIGTGFLVAKDLAVTNLHVLQAIGRLNGASWLIDEGANIDFGYEFKTRRSVNRRRIKKVVYNGAQPIDVRHIDHSKLDLAVVQLEPVGEEMLPINILKWNSSTYGADQGQRMLTIGYPGDPGAAGIQDYTATLLDKLFHFQFGCKRLAPGRIITSGVIPDTTIAHNATTLAGNSGSVIVALAEEGEAFGLHYGGELASPRENWGHVLGYVLENIKNNNQGVYQLLQQ